MLVSTYIHGCSFCIALNCIQVKLTLADLSRPWCCTPKRLAAKPTLFTCSNGGGGDDDDDYDGDDALPVFDKRPLGGIVQRYSIYCPPVGAYRLNYRSKTSPGFAFSGEALARRSQLARARSHTCRAISRHNASRSASSLASRHIAAAVARSRRAIHLLARHGQAARGSLRGKAGSH